MNGLIIFQIHQNKIYSYLMNPVNKKAFMILYKKPNKEEMKQLKVLLTMIAIMIILNNN